MPSPFLTPGASSKADSLAILHLRRDLHTPTVLRAHDDENEGYDEGKVTNTRFGSFPHTTLIGQPWGSQIPASHVDTGSRGRKRKQAAVPVKRKVDDIDSSGVTDEAKASPKAAVAASSGFAHLVAPTPEVWTASLPHRTQVVYTPDYSYILHRLRVFPGSTIIEAGAGSGSFTHAAARAVFNGYNPGSDTHAAKKRRLGKVCSFEFHAQRVEKVRQEVHEHGLDDIVRVTHRDVYNDGFLLEDAKSGTSPKANAVFLDLPAPWMALKHLVREPPEGTESPLDPSVPVHICTFSPCLEQVQRTISELRQYSWIGISMVEVLHHKIEVRRERFGLDIEGVRGGTAVPKSVEESVSRLRMIEEKSKAMLQSMAEGRKKEAAGDNEEDDLATATASEDAKLSPSTPADGAQPLAQNITYKTGRLTHRTESDLKTHTSYLVFATLPRTWTEADEHRCREQWPSQKGDEDLQSGQKKSKKQLRREAKSSNTSVSMPVPNGDDAGRQPVQVTESSSSQGQEKTVEEQTEAPATAQSDITMTNTHN